MVIYVALRFIVAIRKKPIHINWTREIIYFLFVLYMSMVISVTLFPLPLGQFYTVESIFRNVNVIPFKSIVMDISQIGIAYGGDTLFMIGLIARNVLGNILLLLPFGFLAPILWGKLRSLRYTLLAGFIISLGIESLQLLESSLGTVGRITDIDDLICNVIGTALGFYLYKGFIYLICKLNIKILQKLVA
ncbi:VanZ family protein [Paucisalibacillus globulus]|uniref:VanZ family protein n=1 Tax=Paucisalibacillus globulus TaxID=351095 RepID=UPI000BB7149E|nr:VanZ family protein [Paucisalibacillus globulus]